ncbi:PucR family transcriptional regulator [Shouchella patagoniensis]|uniref:PucR family transcriptional regulator n=1 Tax=Shouchella patagoniensis TaxID=228576 RepID=UPI0009957545|nr:PucR family transcriptional regulator [Shouchella patagoniensis]
MDHFNKRGLTVKRLLELDPLTGAVLVAGESRKENVVSRVNIMGSPEIVNFVRPQEFIMTTGYLFQDRKEQFGELIEALDRRGVSGIGIKVQRFIESIPDSLLEKARELHFPVVEIRPHTIFSDVIRVAMEEVFYQESEHLITLYNRVQQFMNVLGKGKPLQDVVYQLEQIIGNPILLQDLEGTVTAPLLEDVLEAGELFEAKNGLESKAGTGVSMIAMRSEQFRCYSIPLAVEGFVDYVPFIACVETNYELTEVDCLTLDKMSAMLGIELTNDLARKKIEKKYLNQFVKDLLIGDIVSKSDINIRASSFDLDFEQKWFRVVLLDVDSDVFFNHTEFSYLLKSIERATKGQLLGTSLDESLAFLIVEDSKERAEQAAQTIKKEVARQVKRFGLEIDFMLYAGQAVQAISDISKSYQKSRQVKQISSRFRIDNHMLSFENLHLYRLLYFLPQHSGVDDYVQDVLGSLEADGKKGAVYIETLETYFQANKNIRATAEQLYTHYNTIVYRLDKIASLLKIDLDHPDSSLELQVALKLRHIR